MSEQSQGWGWGQSAPRPAAAPPAGWYPDPWSQGQHRYWDGSTWTAGAFPHGPSAASDDGDQEGDGTQTLPGATPTGPPPSGHSPDVPPPSWSSPASSHPWATPTDSYLAPPPSPGKKLSRMTTTEFVALVVAVMLVVGSVATLAGYYAFRHKTPTQSFVAPPSQPADPDASILQSLVVSQADVPSTYVVQEIAGGDQVDSMDATLDLCNGTYQSESLRTARLQVATLDGEGNVALSTEAVLYKNAAATAEAFSELRSVVAGCPSTPVVSPVGEATTTTKFNPPPDGSWPQTPTVTRQAYDFNSSDDQGNTVHSVAVYLRRGRVLMGVYFDNPDGAQVPVNGQDSIQAIAAIFAGRIAKLPASVVNR